MLYKRLTRGRPGIYKAMKTKVDKRLDDQIEKKRR